MILTEEKRMKNLCKICLSLILLMLIACFCTVGVFAEEEVKISPKGESEITVDEDSKKVVLEVEIENPPEKYEISWFECDEKGKVEKDEKSLGDKEKLTYDDFPKEFNGQKKYILCRIEYEEETKDCIFVLIFGEEKKIKSNVKELVELSKPSKTQYHVGDCVDLTGLVLKLVTNDGSTPDALVGTDYGQFKKNDYISSNGISVKVSPIILKNEGYNEILVAVGGTSYRFNVKVLQAEETFEETDETKKIDVISKETSESSSAASTKKEEDPGKPQSSGILKTVLIISISCVLLIAIITVVLLLVLKNKHKQPEEDVFKDETEYDDLPETSDTDENPLVDTDLIERELNKENEENDDEDEDNDEE